MNAPVLSTEHSWCGDQSSAWHAALQDQYHEYVLSHKWLFYKVVIESYLRTSCVLGMPVHLAMQLISGRRPWVEVLIAAA